MLASLVAFAATVIFTRAYLHLTGFPQIGNSVLHIAHALWGGLALFVAVLLPLTLANRWAIQASALLSGLGIGLFIDEVGKFITQANDYFFPPALSLIYGFVLLNALLYFVFRRPQQRDPRQAMYHVLEGLQSALDGDLDRETADHIEAQLAIARQSQREEVVSLADAIGDYLQRAKPGLSAAEPGYWERAVARVDAWGLRLGRRAHRAIISGLLIFWLILVAGYVALLAARVPTIESQVVQWRGPLLAIQVAVGSLMLVALRAWLSRDEERGLQFAASSFLLSLVALQLLYFYLSQFAAVQITLLQLFFLWVLSSYRRWYL